MEQKRNEFQVLMDTLRFLSPSSAMPELISGHMELFQKKFETFLKSHIDQKIGAALRAMPEVGFANLLSCPYFCELLAVLEEHPNSDKRDVLTFQVTQAIVAEIRRHDPHFDHPLRPLWTASGNHVFDDEVRELFPPVFTESRVQLNYQSWPHHSGSAGISGFSLAEALRHKERIESGLAIVNRVNVPAFRMVDELVTVIQFRRNEVRPNIVNSSSHTSVGLIRCDNFDKLHTDMPEIVDMLVHESIHQLLHLFEEQRHPFVRVERLDAKWLDTKVFPSPWSGNRLDIRSYSHAILVWFGLVNFWGSYLAADYRHPEVSTELAQQKLDEALVAFLRAEPLTANLGDCAAALDETYADMVRAMEREVRTRFCPALEQSA